MNRANAASTNVARSFFMPNYDFEDLKWSSYHLQLEEALYDAKTGRPVDKRAKESLRRLDSLIETCMKDIPVDVNEKKDYDISLHLGENEFPSRFELNQKWYEFVIQECIDQGIENHDIENQYKSAANATADCQRVIKRILNSEPLRLIPDQVKTFEKLISGLSYPVKDRYFPRHPYRKD